MCLTLQKSCDNPNHDSTYLFKVNKTQSQRGLQKWNCFLQYPYGLPGLGFVQFVSNIPPQQM